jgi:hypothetical protein
MLNIKKKCIYIENYLALNSIEILIMYNFNINIKID